MPVMSINSNIFDVVPRCRQKLHRIIMIWIPLMLVILVLSSCFTYISSNTQDYNEDNWESCYIDSDYIYDPADTNHTGYKVGTFADSLSYQGIQTIVLVSLALLTVEIGLTQTDWLPSSIVFTLFCAVASLSYYSATPILPNPSRLGPSLVVFTYYVKRNVFEDLDDHKCRTAYNILIWYLIVQYLMVGIILAAMAVAIRAEIARRHTPRRRYYPRLEGMSVPAIVAALIFTLLMITMFAKGDASILALDCIYDHYKHSNDGELVFESSLFPFKPGSLDLSTILQLVQIMYVARGYSKLSVSSFRTASVMSLLAVIAAWPSVVGVWKFYFVNDMDSDEECKNYFLLEENTAMYGYPDNSQAEQYCRNARLALASQFIMFVLLHVQIIACVYVYYANKDRPSEVFDPLDAPAATTQQTWALLHGTMANTH